MLTVMLVAFVVLLLASVPIAVAMGVAAFLAVALGGVNTPMVIIQRFYSGNDSFVLLAIPLYILAGSLMETGGISVRLVRLAHVMVGHVRGGLGMVVVVAEYLFSGLSGSVVADVSAVGSLLVPAMVKTKYKPADSVSIVSASSAMGILVPPSIQTILVASITGTSVAALFAAGFLPAMVVAVMLLALIYMLARINQWPAEGRASARDVLRAVIGALVPLGMPLIIFGGIFAGVTTPTEAGALAVVYALFVGLFVYKELAWKDLPGVFARCAINTGAIGLLTATALAFAWLMAMQRVPAMLLDWFLSVSSSPIVFMLLSAAAFILIGAITEGFPALLILLPTLQPSVQAFGISQLHFDTMAIFAIGIGLFLPPIGVGMLIACVFGNVSIDKVMVPYLPYLLVLCLGVVALILFPDIVLWLPRALGLAQ